MDNPTYPKFRIYQSSTEQNRPPISHKVREYLVDFIVTEVLKRKNILLNSKWNVVLCIHFIRKGKFGPDNVFLAKRSRTVSSEGVKLYSVIIPLQEIDKVENKESKTIELMYEAITLFLVSNFKKVSKEFMLDLWQKVDLTYLLSLNYPAPFDEQKYLQDKFQIDDTNYQILD